MKKTLLITTILFITQSIFAAGLSFSELGKEHIQESYYEVIDLVSEFDNQTIPPDAKDPRKKIGYLKILLDVFIFSYPKEGSKDLLLERFDEVVYFDNTINKKYLSKFQKEQINNYSNPRYWIDTLEPNHRDRHKKRLAKIIKCRNEWCKSRTDEYKGWIKKKVYGVYFNLE